MIYKPKSATNLWVNHLSILLALCVLAYWSQEPFCDAPYMVLLLLPVYGLPVALYEFFILKVSYRESTGLTRELNPINVKRVAIKLWGLTVTLGLLAFAYWFFPEYRRSNYQKIIDVITIEFWLFVPAAVAYFYYVDRRQINPEDIYYKLGRLCLGDRSAYDRPALLLHLRSWIIKGFFMPLMVLFLGNNVYHFDGFELDRYEGFVAYVNIAISVLFVIDVVPATIGYVFNLRLIDNHIRSTEDTWLGWVVCLACYPPFWHDLFNKSYLQYNNSYQWKHWLDESWLIYPWAAVVILLLACYSSASVCYGLRWSNLTYRGLIATGVYRITKHPAYLSKSLFWWVTAIPFIPQYGWAEGWVGVLRDCIALLCINIIYYLRAITEERHLSRHPEYREYALWMNDHGLITRHINCLISFKRYNPQKYGFQHDSLDA